METPKYRNVQDELYIHINEVKKREAILIESLDYFYQQEMGWEPESDDAIYISLNLKPFKQLIVDAVEELGG